MCITIYKPKDVTHIERDVLASIWIQNMHGGGYVFANDDKLFHHSSLDRWDWLRNLEKDLRDYPEAPFLIHVRYSKHNGDIHKDNCQPFMVNETLAFAHIGRLATALPNPARMKNRYGYETSETFHLNTILKRWYSKPPKNYPKNQNGLNLLNEVVTRRLNRMAGSSRLVFLDNAGEVRFMNEDKGAWANGLWTDRDTVGFNTSSTYNAPVYSPTKYNHKHKRLDNGIWNTEAKGYVFPGDNSEYLDPQVLAREAFCETDEYALALEWLTMEDYILSNYACLAEVKVYHRTAPTKQDKLRETFIARGSTIFNDPKFNTTDDVNLRPPTSGNSTTDDTVETVQ